ncbi:MAG: sulfate permease [Planctomycetota bacterium]|nr:MAG: sulfate permease [Planctomycetota bacterium]
MSQLPPPSQSPSSLQRAFPFLAWVGELRHGPTLRADCIAGITVALVLIPQSMAYAQLAGLPTWYGLYAAFLPPLIAALWGSSRQLATGPVAMVSLLTGAALAPLAAEGINVVPIAILLALCSGLIQLAMGLLRLGVIINFLSHPVLIGLTSAAAIIIATSQLDKFLGVDAPRAHLHLLTIWRVVETAASQLYWPALAFGAGSLGLMIGLKRYYPKLPAVLIAVAIATLLSWTLGLDENSQAHRLAINGAENASGRVVGLVPQGLPAVQVPSWDWEVLRRLLGPLIIITLVGFVEAASIAKAMALQQRRRHDANQELIGQGLANIAGSFTQAFPCSGSYSRSAVNFSNGAVTGFSSVVTVVVVIICLLFLTPLLYHIPEATLAAVIFLAAGSLIKWRPVLHAWKVSKSDALVALITFSVTLVAAPHLDLGIAVGVGLSILLYLIRTSRPHLAVLARHYDGALKDAAVNHLHTSPHILALRCDARLYFANTGHIEDQIAAHLAAQPEVRVVILFAQGINSVDSTGEECLTRLAEQLAGQGVELLICGAKRDLRAALHNGGWCQRFGEDRLIATEEDAIEAAHRLLEHRHRDDCPLIHYRPRKSEQRS